MTTRRDFLKITAGGVLLAGCGGAVLAPSPPDAGSTFAEDPSSLPLAPDPAFTMGVASGEIRPTSAALWTRYIGDDSLRVLVWNEESLVAADDVEPVDGFALAAVPGLAPATRYFYAFVETFTRRRSPVGTFKTAPAASDMPAMVIGAGSCAKNGFDLTALQRAGERGDLDLFLFLGDSCYADGAETLLEYRAKWEQNLQTESYKTLRAAMGVAATWDDHEVENNWDPEQVDPALRALATQAYFEHQPVARVPGAPDRVWRSFKFGKTAEVFVLDVRGERRASEGLYVSRAQLDWLERGISSSDAVFKLIMTSVAIGDGFPAIPFNGANYYRWTGYPAQRTELLERIEASGTGGVIWLAGEFHFGCVGRAATTGAGSSSLEVLCGPIAQIPNPVWVGLDNDKFDFKTGTNNYTAFHLDPVRREVRVVFHNRDDEVLFDRTYVV